jgi:hypothetical protein
MSECSMSEGFLSLPSTHGPSVPAVQAPISNERAGRGYPNLG